MNWIENNGPLLLSIMYILVIGFIFWPDCVSLIKDYLRKRAIRKKYGHMD